MTRVLLAGRFDPDDPSSAARIQAFAGALDGVEVETTAPPSLAEPLGLISQGDSPRTLVRAIKNCDVVVVAGGNAFDGAARPRVPAPALHTAEVVGLARACRRPVALVGVGAEQIGTAGRALARFVVRSADLLVLRDEPSAATLGRAGAVLPMRVAADPVWRVLRHSGAAVGLDGIVVVVDASTPGAALQELSRALAMIASNSVSVQPWRWKDVGAAALLAAMLPAPVRVLRPVGTLEEAMRTFGSVDVVISMRDHATMAAAAAGTPTVALGRSPTLGAVTRRLGHDVVEGPIGVRQLADVVQRAGESRSSLAAVRREQALVEGSMALLRLLVDREEEPELAAIDGLSLSDGRSP
jgi:polysaccharide pyruvyl transferase WcaK-like protein